MSLPDVCQLFKSYDRQLFKVPQTHLFVVIMLLCVCIFLVVLPEEKGQLFLVCCTTGFQFVPQVCSLASLGLFKESVEIKITSIVPLKVPNINGVCCYKCGLQFWHEVMWQKFHLKTVFQIRRVIFPLRTLLHSLVTFHIEICSFLIKIICSSFTAGH